MSAISVHTNNDRAATHPNQVEVSDRKDRGAGLEPLWDGDGVVLNERQGPRGMNSGVVRSGEENRPKLFRRIDAFARACGRPPGAAEEADGHGHFLGIRKSILEMAKECQCMPPNT